MCSVYCVGKVGVIFNPQSDRQTVVAGWQDWVSGGSWKTLAVTLFLEATVICQSNLVFERVGRLQVTVSGTTCLCSAHRSLIVDESHRMWSGMG